MSNFQSVSVVLFAQNGNTDQQIWRIARSLGNSQCRAEILIVRDLATENSKRNTPNETPERITFRPLPVSHHSLCKAILAAKYETVVVVDPDYELTPNYWKILESNDAPVQTSYSALQRRPKLIRALLWFYTQLIQVLFRTAKHDLRPGITVFKKPAVEHCLQNVFPNDVGEYPSGTSSQFQTTQLLAFCRLSSIPIQEATELGNGTNTNLRALTILKKAAHALRNWWNSIMFPRHSEFHSQFHSNAMNSKGMHYASITPITESRRSGEAGQIKWPVRIGAWCLILTAAICVLFGNLNYPLFEPDEARNSQLALNILESGDWLSLSLQNESYWDKPPLQIWMIALSYQLFGESPWSTRFPIALAALLTVLATFELSKRLIGFRSAFLGSAVLLTCCGFVAAGRYVTMDATLTMLTTITFLLGYLGLIQPNLRMQKRHLVLTGLACGVGLLVKGPVILVLCAPPLLAGRWLARQRPEVAWRWILIPMLLVASPWYIATCIVHPEFTSYFFWKHHVVRFSDAFNHREPFWYYAVGIFFFMFPASYLLPSVFKFLTSRNQSNRNLRTPEMGFLFIAAGWIVTFFSCSESKLPTYILPAFPIICLLMGVMLDKKIFNAEAFKATSQPTRSTFLQRLIPRVPLELMFWCSMTIVAIGMLFPNTSLDASTSAFPIAAWLLPTIVVGGVLVAASVKFFDSPKVSWSVFGLMSLFAVFMISQHLLPAIAENRSIHLAAQRLQTQDEFRSAPIVFYGRESYGSKLILDQQNLVDFQSEEIGDVIEFLHQHPLAIIVSSKDQMKLLRNGLPYTITIAKQTDARHIYLTRPNPSVANQGTQETLVR